MTGVVGSLVVVCCRFSVLSETRNRERDSCRLSVSVVGEKRTVNSERIELVARLQFLPSGKFPVPLRTDN
jgi:hypothetical protein